MASEDKERVMKKRKLDAVEEVRDVMKQVQQIALLGRHQHDQPAVGEGGGIAALVARVSDNKQQEEIKEILNQGHACWISPHDVTAVGGAPDERLATLQEPLMLLGPLVALLRPQVQSESAKRWMKRNCPVDCLYRVVYKGQQMSLVSQQGFFRLLLKSE
jgi:hypothetical protein